MAYHPPQEIIDKYADLIVNKGLGNGKGIKKGDVVLLQIPEAAKPLLVAAQKAVLKAGGHCILQYIPDEIQRDFFTYANNEQLTFFPAKFLKGRIDQVDHLFQVIAESNKHELEGINPKKIMVRSQSMKQYMDWRHEKEAKGKLSWCLVAYGTPAMAKEAKMTEEQYWQEIIHACYLDSPDPKQEWAKINKEIHRVTSKLNKLKIEKLHVVAPKTDLWIGIGPNRKWIGATGHNIPSFECWITPDCRMTEGYIQFTEPLYRYDNLITDVYLEFKKGKVVKATATKGEAILKQMIATPGADMIGEYSLTDKRLSRITKFMAETLYDENVGGRYGNTHLALGMGYKDNYTGSPAKVTKAQWKRMGFNDSVVHTDIMSTSDRTVTAHLKGGKELIIYKDGKFTI